MINSSSHLFAHQVFCRPHDLTSPGSPIPDWHKYLMITFIMFCTSLCACKLFIYYASLAAIGLESTPGLSLFLMWSHSLASGTPFFPGASQICCLENFLTLCFAEWMSLLHTTSRLGAKAVLELLWNSKVHLRYDITSSQQSVDPLDRSCSNFWRFLLSPKSLQAASIPIPRHSSLYGNMHTFRHSKNKTYPSLDLWETSQRRRAISRK